MYRKDWDEDEALSDAVEALMEYDPSLTYAEAEAQALSDRQESLERRWEAVAEARALGY